jgi:soluble lytic murein transglycosylase-like protein
MLSKQLSAAKNLLTLFFIFMLAAYFSSLIFFPSNKKLFSDNNINTDSFDNSFQLNYLGKLTTDEISQMILYRLPDSLKDKARSYLPTILEESSLQGLDPFWVLSVMWTESHFDPKAVSPVGARGLMQLMPATFKGLLREVAVETKNFETIIDDPEYNIRYGIYYLRQLLVQFKHNYYFATLAYNLGPARIELMTKWSPSSEIRDHYYFKVKSRYLIISDSYKKYAQAERTFYRQTYVYNKRGQAQKKRFFDFGLSSIVLDHQASKMI